MLKIFLFFSDNYRYFKLTNYIFRNWERKKLGDVAEKVIQKNNNNAFKNVLTNSAEHGIISQRDFFERNIANKNNISTYYIVQNDDFVYNPRISNSAPYGPINRNKTGYTGIISPLYYVFRVLGINTAFIEWYFKTTCWHKFMYQHGDSGARSDRFSIKDNELKKLPIKLPADDTEQEKIAKTLNSLNNTIQLHERKCEELTLIKQALLQKLFPKKDEIKPEVRYENFSDAWEQRKLGGFLQEYSIKSKIENEYPLLSSTNKGMEYREGRTASESNIGYKILKINDLVLSPQNLWLGNININTLVTGIVSPSYKTLKINNLSLYFLLPQLKTKRMLEKYKQVSVQGASVVRRNLDFTEFMNISLVIPTNKEQEQIGEFFKQLDSLIALHQRKLEKLKQLKKFLLQNMFI
ncbi:restriction endonuclease subunit S [Ligilactobacillus salivarius]|uniref:restriction endonuclease subunit S n=1 Tax=Ligilactobacillus salivarius TaxID=1624 RepID=UPI00296708CB|nr:restriction endonuclease subunit S [Ligilactobacillus salivarius]MDW3022383.1 restriction endonuclease subunit S [Ligilactobacillus salivarius]